MNNRSPNIRSLVTISILVVAGIVAYLVIQNLHFRLVSTNPRTSAVSNISPFLKLNFNRTLDAKNIDIQTDRSFMQSVSTNGKTITINLKTLDIGKLYTVRLNKVRSTDGKVLTNVTVRFVAKDIAFKDLPKDQQQAILNNQDKAPKASSDPILSVLPYATLSYKITGLVRASSASNLSGLYVHVDVYLSDAEVAGDVQTAINTYENEAIDYIRSKGFDPAKYAIEYNVVTPSSTSD